MHIHDRGNKNAWLAIKEIDLWLFSHESKVRNLNDHVNDGILDHVYANLYWDALFEFCNSNDGPEVFSSYASRKSRTEITVWMPWPLNCVLRGGAKWPSNHFRLYTSRCIYVQKHRKCELHACLIGRVPRNSSPAGMQNPKFGLSCVHCVIQISQLLLSRIHCVIQNAHFELKFKIRTLPSCENSLWLFSHDGKVRNLNEHVNDSILDHVYAKLHCDALFELCNSNDGPEVFFSDSSLKSHSEIAVWMPWPLNRDLGGGATWPSNHFRLYTARCTCTEARETRAPCMCNWQGTYIPRHEPHMLHLPLWNANFKFSLSYNSNIAVTSLMCTLRKSNWGNKWENNHVSSNLERSNYHHRFRNSSITMLLLSRHHNTLAQCCHMPVKKI